MAESKTGSLLKAGALAVVVSAATVVWAVERRG